LDQKTRELLARARRLSVIAVRTLREILATAWSLAKGPLIFGLQVIAALVVLFEEWGWKPLSEGLAWLAKFAPIAALERSIAGLPPYGALAVFALPATLLFPLKLAALWLITFGHVASATLLFVFAKVASTALIARIFTLTKPVLMQIAWFANLYNLFVPWKDRFFAAIRESWAWRYGRMVKNRVRLAVNRAWTRWRGAAPESTAGRLAANAASLAKSVRNRLKK
jgi:hypothetical protein